MKILCSLKNISLSFGSKIIFDKTNLTIFKGNKIGLLGLNGKGKSSLFKILSGHLKPDLNETGFQFDKTKDDKNQSDSFSIFHVPQEVPKEFLNSKVKDLVYDFYPDIKRLKTELEEIEIDINSNPSENLLNKQKELLDKFEHLDGWNISQKYESRLKSFSIQDLNQSVQNLSGGEQKKLLLALGLSATQNIILWDEPTNHLDIETIEFFESELINSQKTFLLISHDRYLLTNTCNQIFHINNAKIESFKGNYTEYLEFLHEEDIQRAATLKKLKNKLNRETEWMRQGIKARGTRSKKRVENFNDLSKNVQTIKNSAKKVLDFSLANEQKKSKVYFEAKNLSFSYGKKAILKNQSFIINKGDKIGILGKNGAGKSTLINLLNGKLKPSEGLISTANDLIIKTFSQKRDSLKLDKSPFEVIGDGKDFVTLPNGNKKHIHGYFESFLFDPSEIHRPISSFSGGEKGRLQLALNLKESGDVWIFDEPTNDLDIDTVQILEKTLSEFKGTVIIISHDRSFLENVTNKIWFLEDSSLEIFTAGYEQVAPWLEIQKIEKELLLEKIDQPPTESKNDNQTSKRKLTNKQKMRIKELPALIKKCEELVESLSKLQSSFDFSSTDPQEHKKYDEICAQLEGEEERLLNLYEEKENLDP